MLTIRQLQYDACVKEKDERGEEEVTQDCIKVSKKNFARDYRPEDYLSDPLYTKLVIIDVGIFVEQGDRRSIYQRQSS